MGDVGDGKANLQGLVSKGTGAAAQAMAMQQPTGGNGLLEQRMAQAQSAGQQLMAQQRQKEQQQGQMLGMLAKMFLLGGA